MSFERDRSMAAAQAIAGGLMDQQAAKYGLVGSTVQYEVAPLDRELGAIRSCAAALEILDHEERARVLMLVSARYGKR